MVANLDIYFRFLEDVQDDRCLTLSTVILKNREHQAGERGEYAQQRFFLQVHQRDAVTGRRQELKFKTADSQHHNRIATLI